jgi:hypothetical protein
VTHPAALGPERLLSECETRFLRRSGPGGQNRNKVETAVVLTHRPTGLTAEANERRSQAENRREALFRLRLNLAIEIRSEAQEGGEPSPLWGGRCVAGQIHVNPSHDDFPALLAEVLDAVHAAAYDPKLAATRLGCTSSQLIKFLKLEPRALARVNQMRKGRALHPLR